MKANKENHMADAGGRPSTGHGVRASLQRNVAVVVALDCPCLRQPGEDELPPEKEAADQHDRKAAVRFAGVMGFEIAETVLLRREAREQVDALARMVDRIGRCRAGELVIGRGALGALQAEAVGTVEEALREFERRGLRRHEVPAPTLRLPSGEDLDELRRTPVP